MDENKTMEMEMMDSEKETTFTEENYESSKGGSLATMLVGAALVGTGLVAGKVIGAIKEKKKANANKPKKKLRLMWVEETPEEVVEETVEEEIPEEEPDTDKESEN